MKKTALYCFLLKQKMLAARRAPMVALSTMGAVGRIIGFLLMMIVGASLGMMLEKFLSVFSNSYESYNLMNGGLFFILLATDFLQRMAVQKPGSFSVTPYLLQPVPRKDLDFFWLNIFVFDTINIFLLSFFFTFTFLSATPFYGLLGALSYFLLCSLLVFCNSAFYVCTRLLMLRFGVWCLLLPFLFFLGLIVAFKEGDDSFLFNICDAFLSRALTLSLWPHLLLLLIFSGLMQINFKLVRVLAYKEVSNATSSPKHLWKFRGLEKRGLTGVQIALEAKQMWRNKSLRWQLIMTFFFECYIGGLMCSSLLSQSYGFDFMLSLLLVYPGLMFLSVTPGYEGNYLDFLLLNKGAFRRMLRGKFCVVTMLTVFASLPGWIMVWVGNCSFEKMFAFSFMALGIVNGVLLLSGLLQQRCLSLNKFIWRKNKSTFVQSILGIAVMMLPCFVSLVLNASEEPTRSFWILGLVGLACFLCTPLWMRLLCNCFYAFRYRFAQNMRATRSDQ